MATPSSTRAQRLAARLAEAENPATAPARLAELAEAPTTRPVQAAVARNPNTPRATLLGLAGRFWEAFLENPVLPLLLLEDPGLPNRLPLRVLRALVRREEVPLYLLQTLARHTDREVREGAKHHVGMATSAPEAPPSGEWRPALREVLNELPAQRGRLPELIELGIVPDWLLDTIAGTRDGKLRNAVLIASRRGSASPYLQEVGKLLRRAAGESYTEWTHYDHTSKEYRYRFGQGELSAEQATRLAGGGLAWQTLAVKAAALPPEQVARLGRSPYPSVRASVAGHPNLPVAAAMALAAAGEPAVRQRLASNPATPPTLLASLARLADVLVRCRVARNPNTPPDVLARLASDPTLDVRRVVAGNRRTPLPALELLLADADPEIRKKVGAHSGCTETMYERLLTDADAEIREAVARRTGLPKRFIRAFLDDLVEDVRHAAAYNYSTPRHILDFMMSHMEDLPNERPPLPDWGEGKGWGIHVGRGDRERNSEEDEDRIRRIYRHRNEVVTDEELRKWAQSPNKNLRRTIAGQTTLPDLLTQFAADPERDVRWFAAQNKAAPVEILRQFATDSSKRVRGAVGRNFSTPPELLIQLATDRKKWVRQSVADNKNTPSEVLATLAIEPHLAIREEIASNPSATAETLRLLAHDPEPTVKQKVLENPSAPVDVLLERYATATTAVRHRLGGNPQTPPHILAELVTEPNWDVWSAVAGNPATPPATLDWIWENRAVVKHKSHHLGWGLGRNPAASDALLLQVAAADDPAECTTLLEHPRMSAELFRQMMAVMPTETKQRALYQRGRPAYIFETLLADNDPEVVWRIASSEYASEAMLLEMVPKVYKGKYGQDNVSYQLAANPAATPAVFAALLDRQREEDAKHGFTWWYEHIANHRNVTPEILALVVERVVQCPRTSIRRRVAKTYNDVLLAIVKNPKLDPALLHHFADCRSREVRYAILRRKDCPPELRDTMRAAALSRDSENSHSLLGRAAVLAQPDTLAETLRALYPQARWLERLAMIENPNLPPDLLATLAQDAHRLVRAAARERQATGRIPDLTPATTTPE